LEGLYRRRFDFLLAWDLACFDWSVRVVGLAIPVGLTERWERGYSASEAVDWRGRLRPKYREQAGGEMGRGGAGSAEEDGPGSGEADAVDRPVRYRQVFEERTGFIPNLSILDLLFCEGKNAIGYLRG
jgi:hypothetical protein